MLGYLTLIFVCQLVGELVAIATGWPVPGPVIGMVLLSIIATVALAIPLYRQFAKVRRSAPTVVVSIVAGSATAAISAVGSAWLLGGSREALASLASKSVTTPVAMGLNALATALLLPLLWRLLS